MCCGNTKATNYKTLQKNAPFKVINATYNQWVGGQPGVKGIQINIEINNPKIKLDTVYFRNNAILLSLNKTDSKQQYIGSFTLTNTNKNFQLLHDSTKEYGNKAPDVSKKIPFQLNKNEAVVRYIYKGKINYFKINKLIEISAKSNY
jgi:hypothetical protein